MKSSRVSARIILVLGICGAMFAVGVGVGRAATYWSPYKEMFRAAGSYCLYARENYRQPALNPGSFDFDFNGWHYMKTYSSGCSTSNPAQNFGCCFAEPWIYLTRASDGVVCSTIGWNNIPENLASWGVGKGYKRAGACASTTQFTIMHTVQAGIIQKTTFFDFTYSP